MKITIFRHISNRPVILSRDLSRAARASRGETKTAANLAAEIRFVEQVIEISNEFILGFKAVLEFK